MEIRHAHARRMTFWGLSILFVAIGAGAQTSTSNQRTQSSGVEKSLTGIVTDSMCGATHMAKDKSPEDCTRLCVKQGMKYALVVGKNVYTLEGHETELDRLAGEEATVKGTISSGTITVQSVVAATKGTK